jgi:CRP-like cAMP-binding protein
MDLLELIRTESGETKGEDGEPFMAFGDWEPSQLAALEGLGNFETFQPGHTVIEAGSEGNRDLFIIVSGELEVYRRAEDREHRIALVTAGSLLGEMAFVDGGPRSASVRALSVSKALRVRPEDVDALRERNPAVAVLFMKELARILSFRLRRSSR